MWILKIILKLILSRLPVPYRWWTKLGLFKHGAMDDPIYSIAVLRKHLDRINEGIDLTGKTLLELGPGDGVVTSIYVKALGGSSILVDKGDFSNKDVGGYLEIVKGISGSTELVKKLESCTGFTDMLSICDSRYLTKGLQSLETIDDSSIDIVLSQAVLEHIALKDFDRMQLEIARILKPNGVVSHRVDLKDHLGGGLNNLRFPERLWESNFFSSSGFYTNRLRFNQILESMESAGLEVRLLGKESWQSLPIERSSLDQQFSNLKDSELLVKSFDVLNFKKQ